MFLFLFNILVVSFISNVYADYAETNCTFAGYEKWTTVDNKTCYLLPKNSGAQRATWHDSDEACRAAGGQLASIHDADTNELIKQLVLKRFTVNSGDQNVANIWIGMTNLANRGEYVWTDGTVYQYSNFAVKTPEMPDIPPAMENDKDRFLWGRCAYMHVFKYHNNASQMLGLWWLQDCAETYNYMCVKNFVPNVYPTTPAVVGNCEPGWQKYLQEKCVQIQDKAVTFDKAKAGCRSLNADMLSIHSRQEQNFITTIIADKPKPFIGMKSTTSRGWQWDDQSSVKYTNWAQMTLETDYYADCSILNTDEIQAGKWITVRCTSNHTAICQKPADPAIKTPAPSVYSNCTIPGFGGGGLSYHQYRNSCYLFVDDQTDFRTWDNAETWCQDHGAHLVSIDDEFESAFLDYHIAFNTKADEFWIGFFSDASGYHNTSMVFKWSDRWPNYFTNWADDEPPYRYTDDKTCVYKTKVNGTWRTAADCETNRAYICKVTQNRLPDLNDELDAVCPTINVTDSKYLWVDMDKRSKYCYWFSSDAESSLGLMSWSDATFHCQKRNGTLASVHSYHDLMLFKKKIVNVSKKRSTWIGLYQVPYGDYVWTDGTALDYTYWDTEADSAQKADYFGDTCVKVLLSTLKWSKQKCVGSDENYFICQIEKIRLPLAHPIGQSATTIGVGGGIGIAIGILAGIMIVVVGVVFVVKKCNFNMPSVASFENSLYASRRNIQSPKSVDA